MTRALLAPVLAAAVGVQALACQPRARPPDPLAHPATPHGGAAAATSASSTPRAGASPAAGTDPRFSKHPVWLAAASGDPLDLARLANLEGAAGLLEGFAAGGAVRAVALAALPHADDAALALGPLCEGFGGRDRLRVLAAVHDIVAKPPAAAERTDVLGATTCRTALARLQEKTSLSTEERDLVSSARRMLSEHAPAPAP